MTRIMTNISALNGQRNLAKTSLKMGKTLEKLSSGYRINRAADDAAGLAISEKMRAQIRGNTQALRNAQDGISMLQTAEGAMDEIHQILQRIRELGVQAANGTYANSGPERTSMGEEIIQLRQEIDRITSSTVFNGQRVLTGSLTGVMAGSSATDLIAGDNIQVDASVSANDLVAGDTLRVGVAAATVTLPPTMTGGSYTFVVNGANVELRQGATVIGTASSADFNGGANIADASNGNIVFSNGLSINAANTSGSAYAWADFQADIANAANDTLEINGATANPVTTTEAKPQTYTFTSAAAGELTLTGADGTTQTIEGITDLLAGESRTFDFYHLGVSITLTAGSTGMTAAQTISQLTAAANDTIVVDGSGNSSTLQVGANVPDTLTLYFTNLQSSNLGSGAYKLGGPAGLALDGAQSTVVGDIEASHKLISAIDGAIQVLNSQRGTLGAAQNRLEHTINSLGVAVENLSASESRIRDADIAALSSEMVAAQILQQAGVSVLSQANQTPQAILSLLQG
jgi:flagellin